MEDKLLREWRRESYKKKYKHSKCKGLVDKGK